MQFLEPARRYSPETMNFLRNLLESSLNNKENNNSQRSPQEPFQKGFLHFNFSKFRGNFAKESICISPLPSIGELPSPELKAQIVISAVKILESFSELYQDHVSYVEIFSPFIPILEKLNFCKEIQELNSKLKIQIEKITRRRKPLRVLESKLLPKMKEKNPRFQEKYSRWKIQ
jgi:hypothetical protein